MNTTDLQIQQLQRIQSIEDEIQQLKEKEKQISSQAMRTLQQSYNHLNDELDNPRITFKEQPKKKVNFNSSQMIKSTKSVQEVEAELFDLKFMELQQNNAANSACTVLNVFDKQFDQLQKLKLPKEVNQVELLKEKLDTAQKMGICEQQMMKSQMKFNGSGQVIEVEDLFECDIQVV